MRTASPFRTFDRLLSHAERVVALLDRCRPMNARKETERVIEAWESGATPVPDYRYAPCPDLSELVRALEAMVVECGELGPLGELYADRALELIREVRLVEAVGTHEMSDRAAARFPVDTGPFGERARETALRWAREEARIGERRIPSDDEHDPESLLSVLRALVGRMRLPLRIATTPNLACAAATGDGLILVRCGTAHRPLSARRIALHEIFGHALPRLRAKTEPLGLFSVGTAGSTDDEEGRALLIEERRALLDSERRRELGVRHLAALAARGGADWIDTVRLAMACECSRRDAVRIAARVLRGGGLAREIVYLPARERVRTAFESDPTLESWLERGRIGVYAARTLASLSSAGERQLARGAEGPLETGSPQSH